jgi:hypothetical protein
MALFENAQATSTERIAAMTHPSHAMHNAMQQPLPEPPQDMPTVWIPTDASGAMGAQPAIRRGRNTLALISLLVSLIFPLAVATNVLGAVAMANHLIAQQAMMVFFMAGGAFGTLGLPAMISAIATGHVALVIAKRYTRSGARRWMAIVGLVIGYLSLLSFLGVMAIFIIASMNGF